MSELYIKENSDLESLMHGGHHEKNKRSGTYNTPGIVGLGKAVEIAFDNMQKNKNHEFQLRKSLEKQVLQISNSWINGGENRLPGTVNFGFDFIEGESLLLLLDQKGIAASTGSACSTGDLKPSHVLLALGLPHEKCHGSLRVSIGKNNTQKEIDYTAKSIKEVVEKLRKLSPLGK